ncbi:MAG: glycosyltransferase [Elusimicrobia bacterium]|nr:glycosyltransferase [Elusimicrobiota bacterium]MDE2426608.1 glycosyltransferase [Elusimicrobiota bacterium]
MLVYMVGRKPPPVGGVTIHTERLASWLSEIDGVSVKTVDVSAGALARFMLDCLTSRRNPAIIHCQTSTVWGLAVVVFVGMASGLNDKIIYSLHSDTWVKRNILCGGARAVAAKFLLRKVSVLIGDGESVARAARPYVAHAECLSAFLPPRGRLSGEPLSQFLGLAPFDSPVLVFNAYKLTYYPDGRSVYGLDVLLSAYARIEIPLTLVLLIPQLTGAQARMIQTAASKALNPGNRRRVHIVSDSHLEGWRAIAKADLFVRPTITDCDAISVREALYFGVPTIASDCVQRQRGTVLFRTGDAEDLKTKILQVLIAQRPKVHEPDAGENPALPFAELYRRSLEV